MLNKILALFVALVAAFSGSTNAQIERGFDCEHRSKPGGKILHCERVTDGFVLAGNNWEKVPDQGIVYKMGLDGNVIWSSNSFPAADSMYSVSITDIFIDSNDHLFVAMQKTDDFAARIWKIDHSTGALLAEIPIEDYFYNFPFAEYDSDHLVIINNGNQWLDFKYMAIIDKQTGAVQDSMLLHDGQFADSYGLLRDAGGDLYFSTKDTLYRLNAEDLSDEVWQVPLGLPFDEMQSTYQLVEVPENNSILVFCRDEDDNPDVISIDKDSGEELWHIYGEYQDLAYNGHLEVGDDIIVYYRHVYVGGGTYPMTIYRFSKTNGEVQWMQEFYFEQTGPQAPMDMKVDDDGDIYFAGYHYSGPGRMAVGKLAGDTGELIWQTTPSLYNDVEQDQASMANAIEIVGDELYVFGQSAFGVQYRHYASIVKLDKGSGDVNAIDFFEGKAPLPSYIDQVIKKPGGGFYTMGVSGIETVVRSYDSALELEWERLLYDEGYAQGGAAELQEDGSLTIAYTAHPFNIVQPYYYAFQTDHLCYARISETGEVLEKNCTSPSNFNASVFKVRDLIDDGEAVYIACWTDNQNRLYLIKAENGMLGYPEEMPLNDVVQRRRDMMIDDGNGHLVLLGSDLLRVDKDDLSTTAIDHGLIFFLEFEELDEQHVITALAGAETPAGLAQLNVNSLDTVWTVHQDFNYYFTYSMTINEARDRAWICGSEQDTAFVSSFDIEAGALNWTVPLHAGDGISCRGTQIIHQSANDQLIVFGECYDGPGSEEVTNLFIEVLGSDGNLLFLDNYPVSPGTTSSAQDIVVLDDGRLIIAANMNLPQECDQPVSSLWNVEPDFVSAAVYGKVFWDENQNASFDPEEPLLNQGSILIDESITGFLYDGQFSYSLPFGPHNLSYTPDQPWTLATDNSSTDLVVDSNPLDTICYGLQSTESLYQMDPSLSTGILRCNTTVPFFLSTQNNGTLRSSGRLCIDLKEDDLALSQPAYEEMLTLGDDSLRYCWSYSDIVPSFDFGVYLNVKMPDVSYLGQELQYKLTNYETDELGTVIDSSTFVLQDSLRCAYDPNDKLVTPRGLGEAAYTLFEEELQYTIRFQNTGNDTAFRVALVDTISQFLDLSSFRFVDASHALSSITEQERVLRFTLDPILLPDSSTNVIASQGFVSFAIRPVPDLAEMTLIENHAAIYFDFNPPIITNNTQNLMVSEYPVAVEPIAKRHIDFYPNPTQDRMHVQLPSSGSLVIRDLYGRKMLQKQCTASCDLSLADFPAGLYLLEFTDVQGATVYDCFVKGR